MKTNQEILDDFGEMVVENCVDSVLEHFESLKSKENLRAEIGRASCRERV